MKNGYSVTIHYEPITEENKNVYVSLNANEPIDSTTITLASVVSEGK
jgi:hypothetical protein